MRASRRDNLLRVIRDFAPHDPKDKSSERLRSQVLVCIGRYGIDEERDCHEEMKANLSKISSFAATESLSLDRGAVTLP